MSEEKIKHEDKYPSGMLQRVMYVNSMGQLDGEMLLYAEDGNLQQKSVFANGILNGETISLTPTETKILFILMRNAGRTVTNDFLLRRIWPLDEIFEDTLRVHIHRLRQKIEAKGGEARYIATERGIGYRFLVKAGA